MATRTNTEQVCDRPHASSVPAAVTRAITADGKRYELDLCVLCSVWLDASLAAVLKHAHLSSRRTADSRRDAAALRAWWSGHRDEFTVPYRDRGRIPALVRAAFEEGNAR